MEAKKDNKKPILIIGIALLLLIGGGAVYWFLLREGAMHDGSEQEEVTVEEERYVPEYVANDIVDIVDEVESTLSEWSSDYRIVAITVSTRYLLDDEGEIYYGTDEGEFSTWMFEAYSPSKEAVVTYSYTNGVGDLGDDVVIDNEYALLGYNDREYFNDLAELKSTQLVYEKAAENGLSVGEDNHIYMYLGDGETTNIYGDRYVWRIDERSNTEIDAYDIPVIINTYYVDAKTLEYLD